MRELSAKMNANVPTGLDYYALAGRGERFPQNNPNTEEQLDPRPESDIPFLQALMEGVRSVEKLGYLRLAELGGPFVKSIRTAGGGSKNAARRIIRARMLGISLIDPTDDEAAVGAAKLARRGN